MKTSLHFLFLALAAAASSANAATILFEDEFNTNTGWVTDFGNQGRSSGDYASSTINTSGTDDHSNIHFDANGNEIAATSNFLKAINNGINSASSISQTINLSAGVTYNIYFRYTGSHSGAHTFDATFTLGGDSATTGTLSAPAAAWTSGSFSFTPTTSGSATLAFADVAVPINSDLLIDSVVVSAIPEASSFALGGMAGLVILLRRRRHV